MEGLHFAAGPWFTVQRSGSDWQTVAKIWISDGRADGPADVQIRLALAPAEDQRKGE